VGFKVDPSAGVFPAGLCLLEVVEAEEKSSRKSGDGMFKVKLRDVHTRQTFYENWMMQGAGAGITIPKLKALGVDTEQVVESADLLGRRMIALIKHKDSADYGVQAQIAKAWLEDSPPAEWLAVAEAREAEAKRRVAAEDTPF
jgi:hypothetical protein